MFEVKIPREANQKIFELTLALYRVTDFFPHDEVLRIQIREKANEIFGSVIECEQDAGFAHVAWGILSKIETIKGYLKISRAMRFVRPVNLTVLEREYAYIADYFSRELEIRSSLDRAKSEDYAHGVSRPVAHPITPLSSVGKREIGDAKKRTPEVTGRSTALLEQSRGEAASTEFDMNERQKMIMDHIRKTTNARLSDFFSYFEGISAKTIQRDLQELVESNKLKREGDRRWTIYLLNE